MANSDFLIRAKADTKNYDANLAKAKQQLDNFAKANMSAGGIMKQMSSLLVSTAAKYASFGAAISAIKGAINVMVSALMTSETNVDEWGRTVEASKSVYQSFLQSLNTGDYSGFFSRINDVIAKAKEAYNALDELQTRGGIISSERLRLQARQTELKAIIRREGKDSESGKAAQAELRALEPKITKAYKSEADLNYQSFKELVDEKLGEAGINLNKKSYDYLMRSFSDDSVYLNLKKNAKGKLYTSSGVDLRNTEQKLLDLFTDEWRKENKTYLDASFTARGAAASSLLSDARYIKGATSGTGGKGGKGGSGGGTKTVIPAEGSIAAQEAEVSRLTDLWKNATDQAGRDGYLKQLNDAKAVLDEMLGKTKEIKAVEMSRGFAGLSEASLSAWTNSIKEQLDNAEIGSTLYQSLTAELADANALGNLIKTAIENGIDLSEGELSSMMESLWADLLSPEGISDDSLNKLVERINEYMKEHPISLDLKTGTVSTDNSNSKESTRETYATDSFGKISSGINSMVSSMEQLGVEIPTGLKEVLGGINAITSILTTITAIMEAIEAIQSATSFFPFFAKGGIVPHAAKGFLIPGNDYSDRTPILAQSGELILNRAAQGNIASQLQGAQRASTGGTPYVNGEQIYLGLTNYLRRSGKGELLTARQ